VRRRRGPQDLDRVLGAPALFATAYGDVGSSIYYALGVTAVFALGLTPLVFVIAGIFFAATATTYAEGTVRYPEAGGSSSFARHAFNEVASFGAGWAQMLNYVVTISISAFFIPHYLSVFWEPLKTSPWDIVGGALVVVLLVSLNFVGIRESTRVNVILAVVDFGTQLLLVLLGLALIFRPRILLDNVHLGVAPNWGDFLLAIPIGMIAYTGMETISNLAQETRDPQRSVPRAYKAVAVAVFSIYLTLPAIALMALPVENVNGTYETRLGLPPEQHGFANDPVLGVVSNLGLHGAALSGMRVYVGLLAATILLIAANAGVIGSSRVTYAMSSYRQLPHVFSRLHRRFKTPSLSLIFFSGLLPILTLTPGRIDFLGTMYSFGAMLSFAIANASLIALRYRFPKAELLVKGKPNFHWRGVDWPLFSIVGLLGTAAAWIVVNVQEPFTRWVGLSWLAVGFTVFVVYRRRFVHIPLRATVRAPAHIVGPSLTIEYRSIVVPVIRSAGTEEALVAAARLAAERNAVIEIVAVVEVPLELPLDAPLDEAEAAADRTLDDAEALLDQYGVRAVGRRLRARAAGPEIVAEAARRNAEILIVGSERNGRASGHPFPRNVEYILKHAPCRTMVAATPLSVSRNGHRARQAVPA
jgi:APA family basic amino acid/polyamine antiporter